MPWFMTNKNKSFVWQGEFYPFGQIYWQTLSEPNDHRFPGQFQDWTSGFYYNWHRYYDHELGRYRQPDPIGVAGNINPFTYVAGNPLTLLDPMGLRIHSCVETKWIIQDVAEQQSALEIFWNHRGGGDYDFKYWYPYDTFNVGGVLMTSGEFGNYLTGYTSYKVDRYNGFKAASAFGVFYDFVDNIGNLQLFDWDRDSKEALEAGRDRAMFEELHPHAEPCPCPDN